MKNLALLTALVATVAAGAVLAPQAANAASVRHHYRSTSKHVRHVAYHGGRSSRVSRSGDAETDRLNQQQLDQDRSAGGSAAPAMQGTSTK